MLLIAAAVLTGVIAAASGSGAPVGVGGDRPDATEEGVRSDAPPARASVTSEGPQREVVASAADSPSDKFSFRSELAASRDKDELKWKFSGRALDVGILYRFTELPLHPSLTLGYAHGSGDGNLLAPEPSNLRILTAGAGLRPTPDVHVDVAYRRYWRNAIAEALRDSGVTAWMDLDGAQPSKDVGRGFDIVFGLRNLFGVRRLGVDLRTGWFAPGRAFRNESGDPVGPALRGTDKGFSFVTKFWF